MKTQMRYQKLLVFLTLILSAITIVYSFGFFTGDLVTLSNMVNRSNNSFLRYLDVADDIRNTYNFASTVNDVLMWLGIVFLLIVVVLYITASNKRRNYYVSNYVAVILAAAYAAIFAIVGIALVASVYSSLDASVTANGVWELYDEYCTTNEFSYSMHWSGMFYIGYVLYALVFVDALAFVANLIWKMKLMKGEKALLQGKPEPVREVA